LFPVSGLLKVTVAMPWLTSTFKNEYRSSCMATPTVLSGTTRGRGRGVCVTGRPVAS